MNTESLNLHFTVHFTAPKMPTVFRGGALDPIQNEKTITYPFNAFLPSLLVDHQEDRRRPKVYCRGRGGKNPSISQNIHPVPHEYRGASRDAVSCWVPLHLPPPHLFPGPSASVRWDFSERRPGGASRGGGCKAGHGRPG